MRANDQGYEDLPVPRVLCSLSGIGTQDVVKGFSFTASDPNAESVRRLYERSHLEHATEFVCLVVTIAPPRSEAIEAYGLKNSRLGTVHRVRHEAQQEEHPRVDPVDFTALLRPSSGVVLVLNDRAKEALAVGASDDISKLAQEGEGMLTRIQGTLQERNATLTSLAARAETYAEVRMHRPLEFDDIEVAYDLGKFHTYTRR